MNRYNMELDRITVPESVVDSLMERAAAPRKSVHCSENRRSICFGFWQSPRASTAVRSRKI